MDNPIISSLASAAIREHLTDVDCVERRISRPAVQAARFAYRPLWSRATTFASSGDEFTVMGLEKPTRRADRKADLVEAAIPEPSKV